MTFLTFKSVVKSAVFAHWSKLIHKICLIRSFFYNRTFCTRNPTGISLGCYLLSWIFFSEKKSQISLTFWVSPSATLHLISFRRLTNSNSASTWDHNCHFFLLWRTKVLQHNDQSVLNTIVNPNNLLKVCLRTLNVWVKGQEIFDEWVE